MANMKPVITDNDWYVFGNLTRDWEKITTNTGKDLWKSAIAYNQFKDADPTYVNLTVWPDPQGTDAPGATIASQSHKGTRCIVHGPVEFNTYVKSNGEPGSGFGMSVWEFAVVVRPPWNGSSGQQNNAVVAAFPGATMTAAEKEPF